MRHGWPCASISSVLAERRPSGHLKNLNFALGGFSGHAGADAKLTDRQPSPNMVRVPMRVSETLRVAVTVRHLRKQGAMTRGNVGGIWMTSLWLLDHVLQSLVAVSLVHGPPDALQ